MRRLSQAFECSDRCLHNRRSMRDLGSSRGVVDRLPDTRDGPATAGWRSGGYVVHVTTQGLLGNRNTASHREHDARERRATRAGMTAAAGRRRIEGIAERAQAGRCPRSA
jgi:hypothetical protein